MGSGGPELLAARRWRCLGGCACRRAWGLAAAAHPGRCAAPPLPPPRRLALQVKNGAPPQRKSALRQLTEKAVDFGPKALFDQILPLLMQPTLEDQERHLLVKVIDRCGAGGGLPRRAECGPGHAPLPLRQRQDPRASAPRHQKPRAHPVAHPSSLPPPPPRVLYKLEDRVRPYVHKILVVIEPLLIDEDYYARVEGREIIANLAKAAGLAQMIAAMRPDIDNVDE
jgi:hypothetical protein